jgi:superfamily II DNA/RNA helicase
LPLSLSLSLSLWQTQDERTATLKGFRDGKSRVLIGTDIVARGIDVQQVSIVVNFDLPNDDCNYLHRIGRGGRFGRQAITINLVAPRDFRRLEEIQRRFAISIDEMPQNVRDLL